MKGKEYLILGGLGLAAYILFLRKPIAEGLEAAAGTAGAINRAVDFVASPFNAIGDTMSGALGFVTGTGQVMPPKDYTFYGVAPQTEAQKVLSNAAINITPQVPPIFQVRTPTYTPSAGQSLYVSAPINTLMTSKVASAVTNYNIGSALGVPNFTPAQPVQRVNISTGYTNAAQNNAAVIANITSALRR